MLPGRPFLDASVDDTVVAVKDDEGTVYAIEVSNPDGANNAYLQVFDAASGDVTPGTTTPKQSYFVPALGSVLMSLSNGMRFDTAISIAGTTTATGSTAAVTALVANIVFA